MCHIINGRALQRKKSRLLPFYLGHKSDNKQASDFSLQIGVVKENRASPQEGGWPQQDTCIFPESLIKQWVDSRAG
jgi:hypothetical protein